MNLFLFPESATLDNGYGIGVDFAYKKLKPEENDVIVWNTNNEVIPYIKPNDFVIAKPSMYSFSRLKNVLLNKYNLELSTNDLIFLKQMEFEHIHSDEVVFYRALRTFYPNKHLTIRFHNCFSRILDRKRLIEAKLNLKYNLNLHSMYRLEKEIFNDRNVTKIFISDEDANYYTLMTGYSKDAIVWAYEPDRELMLKNQSEYTLENKLVWFGGVEAHKRKSVEWFINEVFVQIKKNIPDIEFHLYGKSTEVFDDPKQNIFGHGFFNSDDFPFKGRALYVNPDVIGGGIKLKLLTYFNSGIPFISTPFGYEGYNKNLIDNKFCYVEEMNLWSDRIIEILNSKN